MKTPQTFIDAEIKSVELSSIARGNNPVEITWKSGEVSVIRFSTKKEAKYYYDWITGNPKHPIHKNNKEFFFG